MQIFQRKWLLPIRPNKKKKTVPFHFAFLQERKVREEGSCCYDGDEAHCWVSFHVPWAGHAASDVCMTGHEMEADSKRKSCWPQQQIIQDQDAEQGIDGQTAFTHQKRKR